MSNKLWAEYYMYTMGKQHAIQYCQNQSDQTKNWNKIIYHINKI